MIDTRMVAAPRVVRKRAPNGPHPTFRWILLKAQKKGIVGLEPGEGVARMVEDIVGCKWSLTVLALVRRGVNRPGAMEHAVPRLSAKVLNERLRKLQRFGILAKQSFPEVPPRVEYSLTPFGSRFVDLVDRIEALEAELRRGAVSAPTNGIMESSE
jgi:DNA-binding HxlR family transcriptional regulator